MAILQFLKGLKKNIKHGATASKAEEGTLYLAESETKTDKDNVYLYYNDGAKKRNIVPEFIESQSDNEIVITFNS